MGRVLDDNQHELIVAALNVLRLDPEAGNAIAASARLTVRSWLVDGVVPPPDEESP